MLRVVSITFLQSTHKVRLISFVQGLEL
jgi:hypothetical protein